ncbi:MAG TPA: amino acid permease [Tepidisphaeraceae bacterium]|nr:amino acid permease [Tepidisphaeraceae bacterium]
MSPILQESTSSKPTLKRTLGPFTLILYGVGSMLGAGIYGLIGEAARDLGNAIWMAFIIAMVGAGLTALSYANIGSRYPRAGGAAYATQRAYRIPLLTYVVGFAIVASGLTSMATGARVIGRELAKTGVVIAPEFVGIIYLALLSIVVFWGIREAMWFNILCTSIEALGLIFIIIIGLPYWGSVDYLQGPPSSDGGAGAFEAITIAMLMSGAVLTFFSFIGFEDILNVSEECKNPKSTVPIGLVGAMLIATVIYMAVSITAVSVIDHATLTDPKLGGLRGVAAKAAPWFPSNLFSIITCFAVANTALLNYVMGSRLIYGMANQGLMPRPLGKVHPQRRTPHIAIFVLLGAVILIMLSGQLDQLASATVLLLLTVFVIVNIGLIILKFRPTEPRGRFEVPWPIPLFGALVCAAMIFFRVKDVSIAKGTHMGPIVAGVVVAVAVILFLIIRPKIEEVQDDRA